jgi:hypothetical protein
LIHQTILLLAIHQTIRLRLTIHQTIRLRLTIHQTILHHHQSILAIQVLVEAEFL